MNELLRVYLDPSDIGEDGYPFEWHGKWPNGQPTSGGAIKDLIREQAGHRCVRCHHPFVVGVTTGEWSPCDDDCQHQGPARAIAESGTTYMVEFGPLLTAGELFSRARGINERVEAQWRILTVHHLNGIKHDCRWWNLAALCQRCHLTIQAKVYMERPWTREHSEWFRPYVAGFYAWRFLGLELDREETMARLDELLALEDRQLSIEET